MGAVRTDLTYPRVLPDLFRGTQLAVVGRYRNTADLANVAIRLSGTASPVQTFTYPGQRFPLRAEKNDWLPRLWATRRVGWLMEQIRSNGESKELREEVTELGTRYGIVTPYTSFLALEPGERDQGNAPVALQGRAVGVRVRPSNSAGAPPPPPPPPAMLPPPPPSPIVVTGAEAVAQSRASRTMQDAVTVDDASAGVARSTATVQRVGERTFYMREGVWTDAEIRAETRVPETVVTFGSEEYYALLARVPALARYFALGEQVMVLLDGRMYRVRPATP
jgi:Ca-activated chloride channel family protein